MIKCPICGYSEQQLNKQPSNVMNMYQNKEDPKDQCILNNGAKEVTIGKTVYVKINADKAVQDMIKVQEIDPETIKAPELKKPVAPVKSEPAKPAPIVTKAPIIESKAPIAATAPPVELKPQQP